MKPKRNKQHKAMMWRTRVVGCNPQHPQPTPTPPPAEADEIYDEKVGLILGISRHAIPRFSSDKNWSRSVPKWHRRAGKAWRVQ